MFNQAVLKSEKRFNQMGKKMKKFTYAMLGAVLLLAGCRYHEFYYDEEALNAENNAAAESSVLAAETTVTAIPVNDPAASAAEGGRTAGSRGGRKRENRSHEPRSAGGKAGLRFGL